MADTMDALGLQGKYVVKVNNRKVLDGVLETIGLGGEDKRTRLTVLRAIDKLDDWASTAWPSCLANGRKDESGDFTTGAGSRRQIRSTHASYVDLLEHRQRRSTIDTATCRGRGLTRSVATFAHWPGMRVDVGQLCSPGR